MSTWQFGVNEDAHLLKNTITKWGCIFKCFKYHGALQTSHQQQSTFHSALSVWWHFSDLLGNYRSNAQVRREMNLPGQEKWINKIVTTKPQEVNNLTRIFVLCVVQEECESTRTAGGLKSGRKAKRAGICSHYFWLQQILFHLPAWFGEYERSLKLWWAPPK